MIELAMTFCTAIGVCKDVSNVYDSDPANGGVSIMTCMIGAQREMVKWTDAHPGFVVKRWSCGVAGRYAKI